MSIEWKVIKTMNSFEKDCMEDFVKNEDKTSFIVTPEYEQEHGDAFTIQADFGDGVLGEIIVCFEWINCYGDKEYCCTSGLEFKDENNVELMMNKFIDSKDVENKGERFKNNIFFYLKIFKKDVFVFHIDKKLYTQDLNKMKKMAEKIANNMKRFNPEIVNIKS